MNLNRRDMIKRLATAGLVAATIDVPRFFALDQTMLAPPMFNAGDQIQIELVAPTYTLMFHDGETEQIVVGADAATVERLLLPHLGPVRVTNEPGGGYLISWDGGSLHEPS